MSRSTEWERLLPMKKPTQHLIAEGPRSSSRIGMTIGIDLGDVWSHYCRLNEDGEVVGQGRFRTSPSGVEKWFTDLPGVRIAMESGTHSIWISEQLQELGHEVIVANVRELRAISHSDRKSDQVDGRSWPATPDSIRRSCDRSHIVRSLNRGADVDPCPQRDRSSADGGSERGAWTGEALRLPTSGIVHLVLRQAVPGVAAARSGSGTRPCSRTDRHDDGEDQAL